MCFFLFTHLFLQSIGNEFIFQTLLGALLYRAVEYTVVGALQG